MSTGIQWTNETWNPTAGCTPTTPGCTNCYAMEQANRIQAMQPNSHYQGTTRLVNGRPVWTGKIACAPDRKWEEPLRRTKPKLWFVNSMGDLFHPNVPEAWIDRAFATMAVCPQHVVREIDHERIVHRVRDRHMRTARREPELGAGVVIDICANTRLGCGHGGTPAKGARVSLKGKFR